MNPGERLAKQLREEAVRIGQLGYPPLLAHELRRYASAVQSAQATLDASKRERTAKQEPRA